MQKCSETRPIKLSNSFFSCVGRNRIDPFFSNETERIERVLRNNCVVFVCCTGTGEESRDLDSARGV